MSDKTHCIYTGENRVEIKTDSIADVLHTAHDGKNEFVTPGDMLVGALGACTLTMMSVIAEKAGEKLDGTKLEISSVFGPNLSGLQKVALHVIFAQHISETTRRKCLAAAEACPVHKSLNPSIDFSLSAQ